MICVHYSLDIVTILGSAVRQSKYRYLLLLTVLCLMVWVKQRAKSFKVEFNFLVTSHSFQRFDLRVARLTKGISSGSCLSPNDENVTACVCEKVTLGG